MSYSLYAQSISIENVISRICPGKEFADASLFMVITTTLAVFDIKRAIDKDGREIKPSASWSSEFVRYITFSDYQFQQSYPEIIVTHYPLNAM